MDEQVVTFAHKLAAGLDEGYVLIWISGSDSLFQKSFRDTLFDFSTAIMGEMIKLSKSPQLGKDRYFEQNADGYMRKEKETDPVIVPNSPNLTTLRGVHSRLMQMETMALPSNKQLKF